MLVGGVTCCQFLPAPALPGEQLWFRKRRAGVPLPGRSRVCWYMQKPAPWGCPVVLEVKGEASGAAAGLDTGDVRAPVLVGFSWVSSGPI